MKRIVSYLFPVLLVAVYLISTMGCGVHKCTADGTYDVMILFGESICESAHPENGNGPVCSCGLNHILAEDGEHHDGDCCSTDTYVLSQDQVTSNNDLDESGLVDCGLVLQSDSMLLLPDYIAYTGVVYSTGFTISYDCGLFVANSQFRI